MTGKTGFPPLRFAAQMILAAMTAPRPNGCQGGEHIRRGCRQVPWCQSIILPRAKILTSLPSFFSAACYSQRSPRTLNGVAGTSHKSGR